MGRNPFSFLFCHALLFQPSSLFKNRTFRIRFFGKEHLFRPKKLSKVSPPSPLCVSKPTCSREKRPHQPRLNDSTQFRLFPIKKLFGERTNGGGARMENLSLSPRSTLSSSPPSKTWAIKAAPQFGSLFLNKWKRGGGI